MNDSKDNFHSEIVLMTMTMKRKSGMMQAALPMTMVIMVTGMTRDGKFHHGN